MSEHRNLTGASLHEPKGCATAAEGSVYTADGAGSGDWTVPSGSTFGCLNIASNSTTISLTAATDTTLNTNSEYVQVDTGIWSAGVSNGTTVNATSGYIEIDTAGTYEISAWASNSVDVVSTFIAFKFSTDATTTALSPQKLSRLTQNAADAMGVTSASCYIDLEAGDKISLFVAADKTCNLLIEDGGMTVVLLKEA